MKSVTSSNILAWLDSFATHGYPKRIKSDYASYFKSTEFQSTLKSLDITIKYVTEYWPQAKGLVERFKKILLKHVQTLLVREGLAEDLTNTPQKLSQSTPPHRTNGKTPSQLLIAKGNLSKELLTAHEDDSYGTTR